MRRASRCQPQKRTRGNARRVLSTRLPALRRDQTCRPGIDHPNAGWLCSTSTGLSRACETTTGPNNRPANTGSGSRPLLYALRGAISRLVGAPRPHAGLTRCTRREHPCKGSDGRTRQAQGSRWAGHDEGPRLSPTVERITAIKKQLEPEQHEAAPPPSAPGTPLRRRSHRYSGTSAQPSAITALLSSTNRSSAAQEARGRGRVWPGAACHAWRQVRSCAGPRLVFRVVLRSRAGGSNSLCCPATDEFGSAGRIAQPADQRSRPLSGQQRDGRPRAAVSKGRLGSR